MMEQYKGYFIDGSALMIHPFNPDWYIGVAIEKALKESKCVVVMWSTPAFVLPRILIDPFLLLYRILCHEDAPNNCSFSPANRNDRVYYC